MILFARETTSVLRTDIHIVAQFTITDHPHAEVTTKAVISMELSMNTLTVQG